MKPALIRHRSSPIHRRLVQRKLDLWTRSNPVPTPQFLEIASDDSLEGFECPIEFESVAGLESETHRE